MSHVTLVADLLIDSSSKLGATTREAHHVLRGLSQKSRVDCGNSSRKVRQRRCATAAVVSGFAWSKCKFDVRCGHDGRLAVVTAPRTVFFPSCTELGRACVHSSAAFFKYVLVGCNCLTAVVWRFSFIRDFDGKRFLFAFSRLLRSSYRSQHCVCPPIRDATE